uniref:NADH-ubiquinone oxidoreductase chain 6 n=1 Tax=Stricticollis tobias TaxID=879048 RepID=A0A343C1Y0_9CUCU|nr:NADH dehydrogenase subunit 6 [Stricticollis tobias]
MLLLNLALSITFLFMTHPLSMGIVLLLQTIVIALITGDMCLNFWFSYILFLILIGGMLILFIYMTSIASNEKFSLNFKMIIPTIMSVLFLWFMNISWKPEYSNQETSALQENNLIPFLVKYIHFPTNMITIMMIIYLLITLIMTIKIIKSSKGPLRLKN